MMRQLERNLEASEAATLDDCVSSDIDNVQKILRAKPGEIVSIAPLFPGYDTGWLLTLDRCPSCDRPHFHKRSTGECLETESVSQHPDSDPPLQKSATSNGDT